VIRHTVAFRFIPEADPATVDATVAELRALPARCAAIRGFSLGPNTSTVDSTFTHVCSVDFDGEAALQEYLTSDDYERFEREHWQPVIEAQLVVSYEPVPPSEADRRAMIAANRARAPFGIEYARIEVPDLQATVEFLQYHVGLQLEAHTDEYAYLRADIEHHSIELISAPHLENGVCTAIGYSVESEETLESLQKRVAEAGLEILELDQRQKGFCLNGFAVKDPNGLIVELFTEFHEYAEPPHVEIRPIDLVHPFLATTKFDETLEFYQNVLGFIPSDHVVGSTTFLRAEDRYHHSLAIQRNKDYFVAHLCFAMKSLDHVMRLRARALYKGAPIASDIVNHSASTSIAFYLHDPKFGPRFELCDAHRILTPQEHLTHRARYMPADPRNIDVWRPAADDWGRF
jgi:2,3-dihydroxy-p-cumate/2,3-dihydroxybenzoate 3,4-dioxygenase